MTGPILYCTDGHSSRFFYPLLCWLAEKDPETGLALRDMYLTPPNSTGSLCWLDQVFTFLHKDYGNHIAQIKRAQGLQWSINKYEAVSAIVEIWTTWATPAAILRAQRICGFADGSWNVDNIPKTSLMLGDKMLEDTLAREAAEEPTWDHCLKDAREGPSTSPGPTPMQLVMPLTGETVPACLILSCAVTQSQGYM